MEHSIMILCIEVFFCRIMDVSIGTVRTIQIVKGNRALAAAFGFFEIFLWFTVVRQALRSDMGGIPIALSYAAGYASGTFIGCFLSDRFIKHKLCIQVITSRRDEAVVHAIRSAGYAISVIEVMPSEFSEGKFLLLIEIEGSQQKALKKLINALDDKAFIMVNESKMVYNGYFAK